MSEPQRDIFRDARWIILGQSLFIADLYFHIAIFYYIQSCSRNDTHYFAASSVSASGWRQETGGSSSFHSCTRLTLPVEDDDDSCQTLEDPISGRKVDSIVILSHIHQFSLVSS